MSAAWRLGIQLFASFAEQLDLICPLWRACQCRGKTSSAKCRSFTCGSMISGELVWNLQIINMGWVCLILGEPEPSLILNGETNKKANYFGGSP